MYIDTGNEKSEDQIQQMLYLYELYEKRLNDLLLLKEKIETKIKEYENVLISLEEIRKAHDEYVLPLSSSAFVIATDLKKDAFLVNIGSNIIVEMDYDRAKEYITSLKSKISLEVDKVNKMVDDVIKEMEKIRSSLEGLGIV